MKVFLSHSTSDEETARAIAGVLEGQGLRPWLASREIPLGGNYAAEIFKAIRETDCLLLLLTSAALSSEHVKREVNLALTSGRPLLPIAMTTSPFDPMSLPGEWAYWLGVVQIHSAKNVEEAAQVTLSALGLSRTAHARVNPTSVGNPPRTDRLVTHEAQIRSALIQSAAAGGTLQIAIERVKRIGASAQDVMAVAEHLRDAQLLRFDGQLTPRTVIRLN